MQNSVSTIVDPAARSAAAKTAINRALRNYVLIKVGVTVGVAAAVIVVNKIVESKMKPADSIAE